MGLVPTFRGLSLVTYVFVGLKASCIVRRGQFLRCVAKDTQGIKKYLIARGTSDPRRFCQSTRVQRLCHHQDWAQSQTSLERWSLGHYKVDSNFMPSRKSRTLSRQSACSFRRTLAGWTRLASSADRPGWLAKVRSDHKQRMDGCRRSGSL